MEEDREPGESCSSGEQVRTVIILTLHNEDYGPSLSSWETERLTTAYDQVRQQMLGDRGDLADRLIEDLGVSSRRFAESTYLTDVLQGRRPNVLAGARRLEVP